MQRSTEPQGGACDNVSRAARALREAWRVGHNSLASATGVRPPGHMDPVRALAQVSSQLSRGKDGE